MADAVPGGYDLTGALRAGSDVTRTATAPEAPPRPKGSGAAFAGRALLWAAVLAAGLATLAPIVRSAAVEIGDQALVQASDAAIREKLAQPPSRFAPASYFETLGELAMAVKPAMPDAALRNMRRAVAMDPSRAFAWANIAWLETSRAGRVTPDALQALQASMAACTLCDQELVAWRFSFVLAHWTQMPEAVRRTAFDQADYLRWKGEHSEFLAGMRIKAEAAGIPYAAYRDAVRTPVRDLRLGPAPPAPPPAASK